MYELTVQMLIYTCPCILELNNLVNRWQMVEANISLLEGEFIGKKGEKAKIFHALMD